ncbi:hypothetical protein RRG08_053951 [Elysia crispata]|uniref:Uncharacterized protein n=1 Tax=Elysia crispata TaxID=231223 RepID=A0AAE0ZEE9_9GAST|nr:hypothetical protein RRG08_053951 [Elysia crispata]
MPSTCLHDFTSPSGTPGMWVEVKEGGMGQVRLVLRKQTKSSQRSAIWPKKQQHKTPRYKEKLPGPDGKQLAVALLGPIPGRLAVKNSREIEQKEYQLCP